MDPIKCHDCGSKDTVMDYSAGDEICTNCGLVLESHFIDDTPEWRTFSNESESVDRSRVGDRYNSFLPDGGLSTRIVANSKRGAQSSSVLQIESRLHMASNGDDRRKEARRSSAAIAERLGLGAAILGRADEIYEKILEKKCIRGKRQDDILASCYYIACRQEDTSRSIKEICEAVEGATQKEVGRVIMAMVKHLEQEAGVGSQAQDLIRGLCGKLNIHCKLARTAIEMAKTIKQNFDIRKKPSSIAAAVIFMVVQLQGLENSKRHLQEISKAAGVTTATIWETYELLYPHSSQIIPTSFVGKHSLLRVPKSKAKTKISKS